MADQLDIFGGTTPYGPPRQPAGQDPALTARLGRKQANRDRIEGKGAGWERNFGTGKVDEEGDSIDPHTASMPELYGIREVRLDVLRNKKNHVPYGPHDETVFRKAGSQREVPLIGPDALTTMQDKVHPVRVAELVADPSSGSDPRFPGRELPLSVQMLVPHPQRPGSVPTDVLWNGNHRVAAAVQRGEMFTPVQSISQDQMPAAAQTFRRDSARFKESRNEKYDVGSTRLALRDASIRQGIGDKIWDEIDYRLGD